MATDAALTTLTCPKCTASMRVYERNGIVIDQCTECRGVFLDRGELERLIEAENGFYGGAQGAGQQMGDGSRDPGYGGQERGQAYDPGYDPRSGQPGYGGGHDSGGKHGDSGRDQKRRRRGGFLGDLLDFD